MANIYTKTGDKGQTGLVGGSRVSKASPRVNCYGTVDEANSMLGLAYAQTNNSYIKESIHSIQKKLFVVGAELASDENGIAKLSELVSDEDVTFIENIIDKCLETTGKQTAFVVPGVNQASASMHVARTIVRRAERLVIASMEEEGFRELLVRYLNRLSDAIFAMARLEETLVQQEEIKKKVTEIVKGLFNEKGEITLNLELAKKMALLAEEKSRDISVPVVFSVVDAGGNLLLAHRMENALLGSIDISINKAYTASAFKMPTHELGKLAAPGGPLYGIELTNNGKVVIFGGGFPCFVNGKLVGAIGVSGGSVEEDILIGEFALNQALGGIR